MLSIMVYYFTLPLEVYDFPFLCILLWRCALEGFILSAPILTGVKYILLWVLIFISLMASDIEHFFIYMLAIGDSFEKSYSVFLKLPDNSKVRPR